MAKNIFGICIVLFLVSLSTADEKVEKVAEENENDVEPEKLEYAKGSLCGYCDYCKFCKLCDEDCPCESGPKRPNCHMCKYCKYCYLCSSLCDTICQPGGIIDKVSSTLVNALTSEVDKDTVDKDIEGVQKWIDKKKEEL